MTLYSGFKIKIKFIDLSVVAEHCYSLQNNFSLMGPLKVILSTKAKAILISLLTTVWSFSMFPLREILNETPETLFFQILFNIMLKSHLILSLSCIFPCTVTNTTVFYHCRYS